MNYCRSSYMSSVSQCGFCKCGLNGMLSCLIIVLIPGGRFMGSCAPVRLLHVLCQCMLLFVARYCWFTFSGKCFICGDGTEKIQLAIPFQMTFLPFFLFPPLHCVGN